MKNKTSSINCAGCQSNNCYAGDACAKDYHFDAYKDNSKKEYQKTDNNKILAISSSIEGTYYMQWTRLEEIIGFASKMGYKNIGIAHCVGLSNEAKILKEILAQDFNVHAICCKFSGVDKKYFNLPQIEENRYEAICNPIGQAMVLNDLKTDMNIIVGLCIGHDMLFTKYSQAPVTTFIVKDRVTGHNPSATLYSKYYQKKLLKNN